MDNIHIFNLNINTSVFFIVFNVFFNFYYPINIFYTGPEAILA